MAEQPQPSMTDEGAAAMTDEATATAMTDEGAAPSTTTDAPAPTADEVTTADEATTGDKAAAGATADEVAAPPMADEPLQAAAEGRATISRLADEILPLLIARLGASGLGELEVRQDGWRVRLRRSLNGPAGTSPMAPGSSRSAGAGRAGERRAEQSATAEASTDVTSRRERGRVAITSPAVGYYQPRDGLAVGMTVRGGELLGHVDVLGVRQQVVAPEDGILATLSAEAGEAVEYGQTLARLEPEGRG